MTRWEYKRLTIRGDFLPQDRYYEDGSEVAVKGDGLAGFHRAQVLGREGWELVAVSGESTMPEWIFKRPLPD